MQTQTADKTPDTNLTFEKVWATIDRLSEEFERRRQKSNEEFERQRQKSNEEFDRRARETDQKFKETDRFLKRLGKQMGDLNRKFGKMAEHLVAPSIHKRFRELGYHFGAASPGGHRIFDDQGNIRTEIDILLENSDTIMAIEVKVDPAIKNVEHHIRCIEILREHRDKLNDRRKIQGAIAGAIFGPAEKEAAIEAGFYVLEQSGDTMKLEVPEGFVPREW